MSTYVVLLFNFVKSVLFLDLWLVLPRVYPICGQLLVFGDTAAFTDHFDLISHGIALNLQWSILLTLVRRVRVLLLWGVLCPTDAWLVSLNLPRGDRLVPTWHCCWTLTIGWTCLTQVQRGAYDIPVRVVDHSGPATFSSNRLASTTAHSLFCAAIKWSFYKPWIWLLLLLLFTYCRGEAG